jgi:ribosome-associated protein
VEEKTKKIEINQEELQASRELAIEVARISHDSHCTEVVILELADRSPIAKHFVLGTGTSNQQIRAVGGEIAQFGKEQGRQVYNKAGMQQGRWIIVDFVDVVVHLFDEEFRNFYDLELLWGDAPKIDWKRDETDR